MIRIAINGFGRIGKNFLRTIIQDPSALRAIDVVAINVGPADKEESAYSFTYDSLMGTFHSAATYSDNYLIINDRKIEIFEECDALKLPWQDLKIDWVVDVTGKFTKAENARNHITAGAKKVLISAPAEDEDISIVPGVNDKAYDDQKHHIVSLGSCTTNAMIPMLKVLHDSFMIKEAQVLTVHAYTNSQALLDVNPHMKDPRKSRAAALNIIPSSTGASKMIAKILPELATKVTASALRVPVPTVSLLIVTATLEKKGSQDSIKQAFYAASQAKMKGILAVESTPLVSSDYRLNPYSVVFDATLTSVQQNLYSISGWYDNEWGYSNRLKDFLIFANTKR